MKGDLATATIDGDAPSTSASAPKAKAKAAAGGGGGGSFTREELRKLFAPMRKAGAEGCETMELLAGTTDGSSSHPHLLTWLDISANSAGSGGAGGGSGAGGDGSGGGGEPSQVVASLADSVAACLVSAVGLVNKGAASAAPPAIDCLASTDDDSDFA
ncbi:hypothetical protein FOA52_001297 [Chlamydomonas sp. UWO 241]|nr:hypothetical protein FOA52_001297 [Chlamydomonas sp. UWO 241]